MHALLNPKRFIVAILLVFALAAHATPATTTPKRVLLVFQNDGYAPASLELQHGILTRLRKALGQDIEFFYEQLDESHSPESQEQAVSWIRTRYATYGIDVVVLVGSHAIEILPRVPTVSVGYDPSALPVENVDREKSVGVWFKLDVNKTIAAARRL